MQKFDLEDNKGNNQKGQMKYEKISICIETQIGDDIKIYYF